MDAVVPPPAPPRARQIRPGMTSSDYLAIFPAEQLRADLCRRFGTVKAAAKHAGLNYQVVCEWLWRRRAAKAAGLRQLLEACGIPLDPYRPFLGPLWVTLVCPTCSYRRTCRQSELRRIASRVNGQLEQRPDGSYEVPCRRHIPGHRAVVRVNREQWLRDVLCGPPDGGPVRGPERIKRVNLANWISAEVKKATPDPKAVRMWALAQQARPLRKEVREELAAELRKPRPDLDAAALKLRAAQVESAARAREIRRQRGPRLPGAPRRSSIRYVLGRRFLRRPFHLCPLCELAMYESPWHRACYLTWLRSSGGQPSPENWPPRTRTRGPSPERHFRRNLRWLLVQRAHLHTRRELAAEAGVDETVVRRGALAALRLLPGCWDVLTASARGAGDRSGDRTRQRYLPLPGDKEFHAMIKAGERDALIRRLHGFGMPEEHVVRITGASVDQIRGVLVGVPVTALADGRTRAGEAGTRTAP